MECRVLDLTRNGRTDEQIAEELTAHGFRSPLKPHVLSSTVRAIRLKHRLFQSGHQSHPREVDGYYTIPQLAKLIGVEVHWFYDRIHNGSIKIKRNAKNNMYLFKKNAVTLEKLKKLKNGELKKIHHS